MANRAAKLATKSRQAAKNAADYKPATSLPLPAGTPAYATTVQNPAVAARMDTPPYTYPGASLPIPTYQAFPLTPQSDKTSFSRIANALLPYFSTQDKQAVATFLNTEDPNGLYKDYLGYFDTPAAQTTEDIKKFSSSQRAQQALSQLDQMRQASGLTEEQLGSGYKFLKQAIGILQQLGIRPESGEQGMSRAEYENLQAQLAALNSQAQSDKSLAPYAELATKFINPSLIGTLFPKSSSSTGTTVYGQANKRLFG